MADQAKAGVIWWVPLGRRPYATTWDMQRSLVDARRRREIPDLVISVEHPHVITTGRSAQPENLKDRNAPDGSGEVPIFDIERGGDVTYHGPGQLVAYLVFDLNNAGRDLHQFLRQVEEVQLKLMERFGLGGERVEGKTGVWVGDRKLGSVGIAVRHWVTYHGFALNVQTDLRFFRLINPCGFDAAVMSTMSDQVGRAIALTNVESALPDALATVFERDVLKVGEKRLAPVGRF